ncbi:ornithine cyclodeaminase [Variovorax dokdonensis]|uniref:Ornithine cyclodeaminase n=1 Tax=Variovorax dokdonensis TaxID=344883 RepID=A0ABT7NA88_9BURK|nr:ornithine cyclodeaminase [Variovorax dokdonensis]MDM0044856.1 ornithine cyclodeaminase [Variovorax dokdonensis]
MTRFIDFHDMAHLVRQLGVPRVCREMGRYIREDFLRWGDFHKSARVAHHSPSGVIELMPVADESHYAFKYVNGHPGNPALNLPTVMAFGLLADVATGRPVLLSELTLTTALRTAATSVLAAGVLARPGANSMALIGNGAQAEFQALAFMDVLGIRDLRLFDVDARATDKLLRNLAPHLGSGGLRARRCASVAEAVRGADIVTTITADKRRATVLGEGLVAPGTHINAVGGDCPGKTELSAELVRCADVFVEYEPQTRAEGELQQMPADFAVTELWEVLAERRAGRKDANQITLFDSVGFALEDLSALRCVNQLAREHGVGRDIDLVPTMDDPKDLYGLAMRGHDAARLAA